MICLWLLVSAALQPRTHRGKERFPGMTITYALIQMLEKIAEKTDRARIITKAEVFKLICSGNTVVGLRVKKGRKDLQGIHASGLCFWRLRRRLWVRLLVGYLSP